jgi:hypothetical protein
MIYLYAAVGIVIAGLALFGSIEHHRANSESAARKTAQTALDSCSKDLALTSSERDALKGALAVQNEAVAKLGRDSAAATARAAAAAVAASNAARALADQSLSILSRPPSNPADECESAKTLVDEFYGAKP